MADAEVEAAACSPGHDDDVAAAAVAVEGSDIRPTTFSLLDKLLAKHNLAQERLLPTPTNINAIHVPRDEVIGFAVMQQWLHSHLGIDVPLLDGAFVLVPAADLKLDTAAPSPQLQTTCGYTSNNSDAALTAAVQFAIPWRLRQVLRVEVAPAGTAADPADTTVVLVGGDRVAARRLCSSSLSDTDDYQYLCCELEDLQDSGKMPPLKVHDIAHTAWRMRVGTELQTAVADCTKEQAEVTAAGHHPEVLEAAARAALDTARSKLRQLPPLDWVQGHVLQYIELNPYTNSSSPNQPHGQLLSPEQYTQLLQDAAGAWQHYVQCKLQGHQPQAITDVLPWVALVDDLPEAGSEQPQSQSQPQPQPPAEPALPDRPAVPLPLAKYRHKFARAAQQPLSEGTPEAGDLDVPLRVVDEGDDSQLPVADSSQLLRLLLSELQDQLVGFDSHRHPAVGVSAGAGATAAAGDFGVSEAGWPGSWDVAADQHRHSSEQQQQHLSQQHPLQAFMSSREDFDEDEHGFYDDPFAAPSFVPPSRGPLQPAGYSDISPAEGGWSSLSSHHPSVMQAMAPAGTQTPTAAAVSGVDWDVWRQRAEASAAAALRRRRAQVAGMPAPIRYTAATNGRRLKHDTGPHHYNAPAERPSVAKGKVRPGSAAAQRGRRFVDTSHASREPSRSRSRSPHHIRRSAHGFHICRSSSRSRSPTHHGRGADRRRSSSRHRGSEYGMSRHGRDSRPVSYGQPSGERSTGSQDNDRGQKHHKSSSRRAGHGRGGSRGKQAQGGALPGYHKNRSEEAAGGAASSRGYGADDGVRTSIPSEQVLQEFAAALSSALDDDLEQRQQGGGGGSGRRVAELPLHVAAGLMPRELADLLEETPGLSMVKVIEDHMGGFGVAGGRGGQCVHRHVPRPRRLGPVCSYWRPEDASGCWKGTTCGFRHGLPAELGG